MILEHISFWPQTLIDLGTVLAGLGTLFAAIAVGFMITQLKHEGVEREIRLRPLLSSRSVESTLLTDQNGQKTFVMSISFKNYGESPAINIDIRYSMTYSMELANIYKDNFQKNKYDEYTFTKNIGELMPGQEKFLNQPVSGQVYENIVILRHDFTQPDGQIFKSVDGRLYLVMLVKYTDAKTKKIGTYTCIIRFGPVGTQDCISSDTT